MGIPEKYSDAHYGEGHTSIVQEITSLLVACPFTPFVVLSTGGTLHRVPSRYHAHVTPEGNVMVWFRGSETGVVFLPAADVVGLAEDAAVA